MRGLLEVLGDELVGAYLFGSATLGGLGARSDLDVLALVRRRTTAKERQRLVNGLLPIWGRDVDGPRRPIEVTVVAEPDVRPWRHPARRELQYGEWLREAFERGEIEPAPAVDPDLAALLTMVLAADRPLHGTPPGEVFDPVPHGDLLAATLGCVEGLLHDLRGDTGNVVLTLARVWTTIETGAIRSKLEAADWALDRLPEKYRLVLERARGIYLGQEERWGDLDAQLGPFAECVVSHIRGSAERSP